MVLAVVAATLSVSLIGAPLQASSDFSDIPTPVKAAVVAAGEVAQIYLANELRIQTEITGFQGRHATNSGLPKTENRKAGEGLAARLIDARKKSAILDPAVKNKDVNTLLEYLSSKKLIWDQKYYSAQRCKDATYYIDRKSRWAAVRQRVVAKEAAMDILNSGLDPRQAIAEVSKLRNAASDRVHKTGEGTISKILLACGFR